MSTIAFRDIDRKWQAFWLQNATFRAADPGQPGGDRSPFYVLDFFPYPSGAGLHVGHPLGYIASDIIARYMRMKGFNVLHPMGWDSFGLPAEQYAIETGVHPAETTRKNIATYTDQLRMIGLSYDWSREIATTDPDYYRWTQWIFLQLYDSWYDESCEWTDSAGRQVRGRARPIAELPIPAAVQAQGAKAIEEFRARRRLAFLAEVPVNWCPALGTVLANEEVTADGRSERGNHPVFKRPLKQWILRITAYAERLLNDLEPLDWPEPIKLQQRNWIGRSEGAFVRFAVVDHPGQAVRVFTTRPDTLYGATYVVLSPEHPLVPSITSAAQRSAVDEYVAAAAKRSDVDRTAEGRAKTGVFTGAYALNPVNGERLAIWIADYVLAGYGTGAIMAVPAHDQRDYEFAQALKLPIRDVVYPRTVMAIKYFCDHATAAESAPEAWKKLLADFLGAVTSENETPAQFETGLHIVRTRRKSETATPTDAQLLELKRTGRALRGAVQLTWIEAIDALNFPSFEELRHTLQTASFFAREGAAFGDPGYSCHSASAWHDFNGLRTAEMKAAITRKLAADGLGEAAVQYKLRDWLFSRQRYWGEPFPLLHDADGMIVPLTAEELPLQLPEMADFRPTASDDPYAPPQTPLSRAGDWIMVERAGRKLWREANTMPQWAGSCWYYLRFCDPRNHQAPIDARTERYWSNGGGAGGRPVMPSPSHSASSAPKVGFVDLYIGGAEHAVLHLLYARFWHKVLYDRGIVTPPEPFQRLFNQGMITAMAYRDGRGVYVDREDVVIQHHDPSQALHRRTEEKLFARVEKMSKSKKNVVNPDEICNQYGADTLRLYEMFLGPIEAGKPWSTDGINGVYRFLQRAWRLVVVEEDDDGGSESKPPALNPRIGSNRDAALERVLHKTIAKVTGDVDRFAFNTAISEMMVFITEAGKAPALHQDQVERFVLLLAPFAPHLAEEMWQRLGHAQSLARMPWPTFDPALTRDDLIEIAVQVNGKVRARMQIAVDAADDTVISQALALEAVSREIAGRPTKRAIVVKGRLVNLTV